jgi:hypothetical protein
LSTCSTTSVEETTSSDRIASAPAQVSQPTHRLTERQSGEARIRAAGRVAIPIFSDDAPMASVFAPSHARLWRAVNDRAETRGLPWEQERYI